MTEPTPMRGPAHSLETAAASGPEAQLGATPAPTPEQERAPMLDVHPPHQAAHTWKDFWIHLGTIAIGLLIAIGLEQSVEGLHRLHQRHQLEDDLHSEGFRNEAILRRDLKVIAIKRADAVALRANVDALRRSGGKAHLAQLPPQDTADLFMPTQGAWASARDSSRLALLPRERAEMYEELYSSRDFLSRAANDWFASANDLANFANQFRDKQTAGPPDLSKLSPEQLDQYSALLTRHITESDWLAEAFGFFAAANRAVLDGATSEDDLQRRMGATN